MFLVSVPFAPRVTSQLKHGFGDLDTESRAALSLVDKELGFTESSVTLVFSSETLDVDDPAYAEAMEQAIAPLRQLPEVVRVVTYHTVPGDTFVADDRRTTYAFVELDASVDEAVDLVEPIRSRLGETELGVWVTGGIALFADLSTYSERDLQRAELITIPLLAILLLLVFGSVVAAGLPVAMGALSVVTTLALSVRSRTGDRHVYFRAEHRVVPGAGHGGGLLAAYGQQVQRGASARRHGRICGGDHDRDLRQGNSVLGGHVRDRAVWAAILRHDDDAVPRRGRHHRHTVLDACSPDPAARAVRGAGPQGRQAVHLATAAPREAASGSPCRSG